MKAFTKIMAAAIAAIGVVSVAGCSGATPSAKTVTNANWNVRTSTSVEKSFTERWMSHKEVAQYSIRLTAGENVTYKVEYYDDGYYKTQFFMTYYDWSKTEGLPEGYAPAESTSEPVYVYTTELKLSGKYTFNATNEEKDFDDSVKSVCYYRLAGDNLQPVYSYQEIKNTAPNELNASSPDNMLIRTDNVFTTYYNYNCTKATVIRENNLKTENAKTVKEIGLTSKQGYSLFDNSQLRAAVRAFNISSSANHTFNVLVPQNGSVQTCYASSGAPVELTSNVTDNGEDAVNEASEFEREKKQIIDALDNCGDYIPIDKGEGENALNYRYNAVTMGLYTDSPMIGSAPTLWYSTVENSEINYTRCVLLRMSTPLSYGIGTLNYTLKSLSLQSL